MQSIGSATGLSAVPGVTVVPVATTPPGADATVPAARAVARSADVAVFGRDTFAVFSVDRDTKATRIAIYDGDGRLLRMIPQDGVADMLSQIAAYRRLR
jgi:hypothetical protein